MQESLDRSSTPARAEGEPAREGDNHRQLVSVVIPVFNESAVLPRLLERLEEVAEDLSSRYSFEFVLVDDGSTDGSLARLTELLENHPRLRVVELRRNYGQTAALQAGFERVSGEIVVSMDADLQHFPEEIPAFLEQIEAGNDVVCGWRHDRKEGPLRRWPSAVANKMLRAVTRLEVHDIGTTFRAYRREILDDVFLLGENHRFVPAFARMAGARIAEVKISNISRPTGASSYGLGRTLGVFLDLFVLYYFVRHLDRPVRIFGKVALALFSVGIVIAAWLLWLAVAHGVPSVRDHSGWFMLSIALLVISVQVMLTGVLAEVLARLYYEPGKRTPYRVRREWSGAAH